MHIEKQNQILHISGCVSEKRFPVALRWSHIVNSSLNNHKYIKLLFSMGLLFLAKLVQFAISPTLLVLFKDIIFRRNCLEKFGTPVRLSGRQLFPTRLPALCPLQDTSLGEPGHLVPSCPLLPVSKQCTFVQY